MNNYVSIGSYFLELPILLGIVTLVLVSLITVLTFFYGLKLKVLRSKRLLVPLLGSVLLISLYWVFIYSGAFQLDRTPRSAPGLTERTASNLKGNLTTSKDAFKHRYFISQNLKKLGFVKAVYDDGKNTYFHLNAPIKPQVFTQDEDGNLINQQNLLREEDSDTNAFPILVAENLSIVWYLQFNSFIGHIIQFPTFKPNLKAGKVKVYFSDSYHSLVQILKDHEICELSNTDNATSRVRHYFVFEHIRHYIDECEFDKTQK